MNEEKKSSKLIPEEIATKGEEIYEKELKDNLEPQESGKYVAIEVESKKYFIGSTKEEALDKAQEVFPDKIFFVRKIGELERVSSKYSFDFTSLAYHDRLF